MLWLIMKLEENNGNIKKNIGGLICVPLFGLYIQMRSVSEKPIFVSWPSASSLTGYLR